MRSEQWTTYRTRFLVKAKQLNSTLSFTDQLGRKHCGRKGDYLVESCDGVLSIAPRRIFEDIYVPMSLLRRPHSASLSADSDFPQSKPRNLETFAVESMHLERLESRKLRERSPGNRRVSPYEISRARRKSLRPAQFARTGAELAMM
jgi:hypothetical protein